MVGDEPAICSKCSKELIERQAQQVLPLDSFVQARQRMSQAFREDKGLVLAYHANIAMLAYDRHGVSSASRDALARDVLALVFGLTEEEATP